MVKVKVAEERRRLRRRTVLPPQRSILSNIWRTVLQVVWDISQPTSAVDTNASEPHWLVEVDDGFLYAEGWKSRISQLFNETKVHRITARYMPYMNISQPGEYIFSLFDEDENLYRPVAYPSMLNSPGTVIRKCGSVARLEWFPTEPSDSEWHVLGDGHVWCRCAVSSVKPTYRSPTYSAVNTVEGVVVDVESPTSLAVDGSFEHANIAGKVVVDVDASFRGRPEFGSEDPEYAQYLQAIRCLCDKCFHATACRRLLTRHESS